MTKTLYIGSISIYIHSHHDGNLKQNKTFVAKSKIIVSAFIKLIVVLCGRHFYLCHALHKRGQCRGKMSVCLSVTRRYCVELEAAKHIKLFTIG